MRKMATITESSSLDFLAQGFQTMNETEQAVAFGLCFMVFVLMIFVFKVNRR